MAREAVRPIFIFLPVEESPPDADGLVVDPVCGRALPPGAIAGRLLHGGKQHYFCSLGCAEQFAAGPSNYSSR
jgi:Cu+-exporting ATPase